MTGKIKSGIVVGCAACLIGAGCGDRTPETFKALRAALSSEQAKAVADDLPFADQAASYEKALPSGKRMGQPTVCGRIETPRSYLYRQVIIANADGQAHVFDGDPECGCVLFMFSKTLAMGRAIEIVSAHARPTDDGFHFAARVPRDPLDCLEDESDDPFARLSRRIGAVPVYKFSVNAGQAEAPLVRLGVRLSAEGGGSFSLDGKPLSETLDGVKDALVRVHTETPDAQLVFDSGPDVPWDYLASMINMGIKFGLRHIRIQVTYPSGKTVVALGAEQAPADKDVP